MVPLAFEPTLWQQHMVCVVLFGVVVMCGIAVYRRVPNPHTRRRTDFALSIVGFGAILLSNGYWLQPERLSLTKSLPLELCDVAAIIAPFVLLTSWRPLRAILHFWAWALCSQWVFTPVTPTGPETLGYWVSFALHASILGTAALDFGGRGFRPRWADWRTAILAGVGYVILVLPMNLAIGGNYGYVGNSLPGTWTIVNVLGPWPWRVPVIMAIAVAAITVVKLLGGLVGAWLDGEKPATPSGTDR